ncbi:MAG: UDP-N-acetylmuramoylalanine--D-glutamate ligase [Thermodesulfobacteriota bacterium]|nr:UDP-N-acetylmuramoylalanine--D-glutamate ligase [Thermodesulfobacteriota bacterium]
MVDPREIFEGKRVIVMGLGLLGRGLGDTLFLLRQGAIVTVTDLKTEAQLHDSVKHLHGQNLTLKLGSHDEVDFTNADCILRNADVPRSSKYLEAARRSGVPVEMDESLFCKYFKGTVVGITGTRGKTTTTTLIHRILADDGRRVHIAGNIRGHATLPLLEKVSGDDTVVLELSSWQLQGFHDAQLSPNASVFTNVYPDHLNRYENMDEYIYDKKAIYRYQKGEDFCLFNQDQPEGLNFFQEAPAGKMFFSEGDVPANWNIQVPGRHNRSNIAAAASLCRSLGASETTIQRTVENFTGVEHRLQLLGIHNGVQFINDATSTTPVAGCMALNSVEAGRIFLIAGGSDKKLDPACFVELAARKTYRIALLRGEGTEPIRTGLIQEGAKDKIVGIFDSLKSATLRLVEEAEAGDVVLLSPACASFGMFQNEFHRGETFMAVFQDLLAGR